VVASKGSVVAVPLIGWLPLQPPEAMQLCAAVAFHCRVAAVPRAMLLLTATKETTGFAASVTGFDSTV
jgi:hypothetical protein